MLTNHLTGEIWDLLAADPLDIAGRLVQEDLCLIQQVDNNPVFTTDTRCFPSPRRLGDRLGRQLADGHRQVQTDYDPEGISIPAQRAACLRKAEQMGVTVTDEYVEPGKSATSMDRRPVFQQMMAELRTNRETSYVIVYNLSRLNRNRVDDPPVLMTMRSPGATRAPWADVAGPRPRRLRMRAANSRRRR